jgi:hypothetical protein
LDGASAPEASSHFKTTMNEQNCEVTGKRKYLSEREALETATHQLSLPNAPKQLKTYLCTWCETWHLTKSAGKNK